MEEWKIVCIFAANLHRDCWEEGEVNNRGRVARTPIEIAAVGGLTRGKDPTGSGGYRMIILQIIGGKFGGMEKSLYLRGDINNI